MVSKVPLYHPDVRVTLYKTISRSQVANGVPVSSRYSGSGQTIDLTQFLGEGSGILTTKSVREPAGGFTLALADKPYAAGGGFESLYGLIEPMDFVEIRFRHGADLSTGAGEPPVIMRGFVSDIDRGEAIGQDGRPVRTVTISGQDYGKLWQILQIRYLPGYVIGQETLSSFRLFERFGAGFQTGQPVADFVREFIAKVLNPYIQGLMPAGTSLPTSILTDTVTVQRGTTSLTGIQNQEGSFHSILAAFCDVGIWNELYLEDREDGVHCVFRPVPYKDVSGNLIDSDAEDLEPIDVPDRDVASLRVRRSDSNIANYYWVRGPRFDLNTEIYRKQALVVAGDPTVDLSQYANSAEALYGIRLMDVETQTGGDETVAFGPGQTEQQCAARDTGVANWLNDRRRLLSEFNRDNVLFESGTIQVSGNENIRAGSYVRLHRGSFTAIYYVTKVDHQYTPFSGNFVSTLSVERGTGFIERIKRGGGADSPYLAEMRELP